MNHAMHKKIRRRPLGIWPIDRGGFTLVELMVALTLFTVVALATMSSLLIVNDASRRISHMRSLMDNLNFAIDAMNRSIRTSTMVICGASFNENSPNCSLGDSDLEVRLPPNGRSAHQYSLSNGRIRRSRCLNGSCEPSVAITAPEIEVENLTFYVSGANPGGDPGANNVHSLVHVFVQGAVSTESQVAPFYIQTTLSPRTPE